jgi:hypothetical protein
MYSIDATGGLIALVETPYPLEADLQTIVGQHPALLAGDQMDAAAPRRFVLATAEAGIAISESSGSFFSLDLLFLDQDGILTLVEVKRSSDTRLRREVIGQILEYAANVCAFWSAEKVRSAFERNVNGKVDDAGAYLETVLGLPAGGYDNYWQSLQANLDQNRLRLVIVADKIPVETLRIIEYLNRQMVNTDVFAVTVSQFVGGDVRTLTARLLNPSVAETQRKASSLRAGAPWTRERFYDALLASQPPEAAAVMQSIEAWATTKRQVELSFGSGTQDGSIRIAFRTNPGPQGSRTGADVVFLTLWTYGSIEVDLEYIAKFAAFREDAARSDLVRRLNEIGCDIPQESIRKRPNISWTLLNHAGNTRRFIEVQDWVVTVATGAVAQA